MGAGRSDSAPSTNSRLHSAITAEARLIGLVR